MEISTSIDLNFNNYIFARISKCRIYAPHKTFAGIEMTLGLTIKPTSRIKDNESLLDRLTVDLYIRQDSSELYIGRLQNRFITPLTINYSKETQQQLHLSTETFLKLSDETHYKDLELKLDVQAWLKTEESLKNSSGGPVGNSEPMLISGEGYLTFPHSEWLKTLNAVKIDRFDLITLRATLSELPESDIYAQAFDKLKEAQDKFTRGDWNAVGSACRGALGTIMSLAPKGETPLPYLLSNVLNDPKRQRFGESIRPIWNSITVTTHSEAKAHESLPTADYQREDVLLTLHLTAAAISYIAAVHK